MKSMFFYFERLSFGLALKVILLKGVRKLLDLEVDLIYSQFGEGLVLSELFQNTEKAFYVDVGCNNPVRFSNTFLMYLKGGQGIVIDANEKQIVQFRKHRKKDIAIHAYLSKKEETTTYFEFETDLTNTLDATFAKEWSRKNKLIRRSVVKTTILNNILDMHLPHGQNIDLLNIDVEGLDFDVISSLDFSKYTPNYICIEIHDLNFENLNENRIYNFLISKGYKMISHIYISSVFKYNKIE